MFEQALLVAHIAVLGYWLGSELVINATYRYVSCADAMPFAERDRLMEHVMHVDQHVRYALVLQAALGTALAVTYGYIPGGRDVAVLHFEEVTERRFAGWTMGQVNLTKVNPSIVLKYSEKPTLDPYGMSGRVSMALLEELIATASIIGRTG